MTGLTLEGVDPDERIPSSTVLGNISGANALPAAVTISAILGVAYTVVSKLLDYALLVTESYNDFDNNGAAAAVTFTLPAAAVGLAYGFAVVAAHAVTIKAPIGVTLRLGELSSTSGGTISSSSVGSCLFIKCRTLTDWFVQSSMGSWTAA